MIFSVLLIEFGFLVIRNMIGDNLTSDYLIAAIIVVFSLAYLTEVLTGERFRDIRSPLALGYLFRIALMLFDLYGRSIYGLPHSGKDSEGYYHSSVLYAQGNGREYGGMFSKVMGTIYSTCGTTSRLFGQFVIVLFSVAAMHMAGAIMRELGISGKNRKRAMYFLCLLPNFAILSSVFMRESIMTMLISFSLYWFVLWINRKKEVYFLCAIAAVCCSATFHSGTMGMAIGYIVVRFIYNNRQEKLKLSASGIVAAAGLLCVMTFLYNNYSDLLFGKMQDIESISDVGDTSQARGFTYAQYIGNSNTPLNMLIYTAPRIIFFLFSPFPWQWRGLEDVIAFCFSSMFYAVTITRTVKYLSKGNQENRKVVITLLILAACTLFVFGWGTSNSGTAIRHRDKVVVLYAVLYGLTATKKKPEKNFSYYTPLTTEGVTLDHGNRSIRIKQ